MPTDLDVCGLVALFLFAHQDDEFGVFQQILLERARGHRVVCAYFTTGVPSGHVSTRRDRESVSVLRRLGVGAGDIFFAGSVLSIDDGQLAAQLPSASEWFDTWLIGFPNLASVYVPAWEGGHPDHDALHAMIVQLIHERKVDHLTRQFPLYNGCQRFGPFFRVLFPLSANGPVEFTTIPWSHRLRFAGYCLRYPSQIKSWIGLFPFVLLHYILRGNQALQPVRMGRTRERPHKGRLYYERRNFSSWARIRLQLTQWQTSRPAD